MSIELCNSTACKAVEHPIGGRRCGGGGKSRKS